MGRPHAALIELAAQRPAPPAEDAAALIASAREHRMQGLLWDAVERGEVRLPKPSVAELARDHLQRRAYHQRLWRALEDIDRRLAAAGLEVATFKGVAAEVRWYPALGMRPCKDLDLVIRPDQLGRIDEAVRLLQPDAWFLHDARELVGTGVVASLDIETPDGIEVDLHADVLKVEVPTRQREVMWQRTVRVPTPTGGSIRALDAELSLVQFLLHLNKDRFAQLVGYADVARLLRAEQLDWDAVDRFVRGEGLSVPVHAALDRVVDTLRLPSRLIGGHARRQVGVRAAAWQRLWPEAQSLEGYRGQMARERRQLWLPFLASGRQLEALRWWVRRRLFPPRRLLDYYLPDTSGPYLWRLLTGRLRRRLTARQRMDALSRYESAAGTGASDAKGDRPPARQP